MEQMQDWLPQTTAENPDSISQLEQLIAELKQARQKHAQAKAVSTDLYHQLEEVEQRVMGALKAAGRSKFEAEGVAAVRIQSKEEFNTPKELEHKRVLFKYIQEKYGVETLTGMLSINYQTLNSWAKKEIAEDPALQIPGLGQPTSSETLFFSAK